MNDDELMALMKAIDPMTVRIPPGVRKIVDAVIEAEREACAKVCESFRDEASERWLEDASREAKGAGDELTILRSWSNCRLWNAAHERSTTAIRSRSNKGE